MRITDAPFAYVMPSNALKMSSSLAIGCRIMRAVPRSSAPSAAPHDVVELRAPVRIDLGQDLVLHPGRERLVEPEVVPPRGRDQIAEPVVRDLVRRVRRVELAAAL